MASIRLIVIFLVGCFTCIFAGNTAAANSSATATAQIMLIFPSKTTWRQAEAGNQHDFCLQNVPTQHISVSILKQKLSNSAQAFDLGAQGCLSELDTKGVSELIISAE
ncbi:hypothetical protein ACCI51_06370 [Microbulbifer echini]|uniref:Uncharacterized protein n=1 Tax=Microbulbifer echini TaxID=1529067 RepID=A0ABV4NKS2_9GAMM|nr:hypothetical protein [uncultured Microbulbifer sp.]